MGREAAEGIQRVDRKLAAQSPRSCPSDTTGSVKRVDFRSSNFNGDVRRVACNEWVETNSRGNRWIFRPITNNGSELVLHDGSRDIYFKADFSARRMSFRNGAKAAWAGHSDIVSSERVGGDVSEPDRPSVAKKGADAPKPKTAKEVCASIAELGGAGATTGIQGAVQRQPGAPPPQPGTPAPKR